MGLVLTERLTLRIQRGGSIGEMGQIAEPAFGVAGRGRDRPRSAAAESRVASQAASAAPLEPGQPAEPEHAPRDGSRSRQIAGPPERGSKASSTGFRLTRFASSRSPDPAPPDRAQQRRPEQRTPEIAPVRRGEGRGHRAWPAATIRAPFHRLPHLAIVGAARAATRADRDSR